MFYLLYVSSHKPNTGIISWNFTILVICHHICWEINQCCDNGKVYGSKISCRWISQNFDEISYFTKLSNMKLPYMTILPMGWIKKWEEKTYWQTLVIIIMIRYHWGYFYLGGGWPMTDWLALLPVVYTALREDWEPAGSNTAAAGHPAPSTPCRWRFSLIRNTVQ